MGPTCDRESRPLENFGIKLVISTISRHGSARVAPRLKASKRRLESEMNGVQLWQRVVEPLHIGTFYSVQQSVLAGVDNRDETMSRITQRAAGGFAITMDFDD